MSLDISANFASIWFWSLDIRCFWCKKLWKYGKSHVWIIGWIRMTIGRLCWRRIAWPAIISGTLAFEAQLPSEQQLILHIISLNQWICIIATKTSRRNISGFGFLFICLAVLIAGTLRSRRSTFSPGLWVWIHWSSAPSRSFKAVKPYLSMLGSVYQATILSAVIKSSYFVGE